MDGGWGFSRDQFNAAYDEWENRFRPSQTRRLAFLDWALSVMEAGPPAGAVPYVEPDTQVVADPAKVFTFDVPVANVNVIYLVVEAEKEIAPWEIWG